MEHDRQIPTYIQLHQLLKSHGIDTSLWGTGRYKSLQNLLDEIAKEETKLEELPSGEILRVIRAVTVDIRYQQEDGSILKLFETSQEFPDGSKRIRSFLDGSVSGKVEASETDEIGARREIEQELQVNFTGPLTVVNKTDEIRDSESFPGLSSRYLLTIFRADFGEENYKPEGYVEIQDRIKTTFEWKKIDESGNPFEEQ